jgi:steroid delta-isomerase-like uncharacterized protein
MSEQEISTEFPFESKFIEIYNVKIHNIEEGSVQLSVLRRGPINASFPPFAFEGGKMSIQKNKKIARRFIQIWGKGNLDIIDELAAPSISVKYPVMPQTIRGTQMLRQVMENFRSAFPDSDLLIEEEIAEDDKVVIRWSFSGTHQGSLSSIPATGKKVKWTGITIYRIVEGKVMEEKGEEDFLGFLRQIGLVPKPQ